MRHFKLTAWLLLSLLLVCCRPEAPADPSGSLRLKFSHRVDGDSLQFNSLFYPNAAGNEFRVMRLKYFISGVKLFQNQQLKYQQEGPPKVINALHPDECQLWLEAVPVGSIDSLAFAIGVVPEYNFDNALNLAPNDLDMYWPTTMGGGYHFMKFEGHWRDRDQFGSYAFHLGQNENLIRLGLTVAGDIAANAASELELVMNLAQWFDDPHRYDLRVQGGYTMGDSLQMKMLVENAHNVFSLKP